MAEEQKDEYPVGRRIYLEQLSEKKHLEDFHELWGSEESVRWSTKLVMNNIEESRVFMRRILRNEENPDIDKFAILLKPSTEENKKLVEKGLEVMNKKGEAKCIGMVGTNRWSVEGMETGYCLNSAYWNLGFATEAFSLFLSYYWKLPQRKAIPHLVAKTNPENIASIKVLQKCGGRNGGMVKLRHPFLKKEGLKDGVVEVEGVEVKGKEGGEGEDIIVACWYFDRFVEK